LFLNISRVFVLLLTLYIDITEKLYNKQLKIEGISFGGSFKNVLKITTEHFFFT